MQADVPRVNDVPPALRGTIAEQCTIDGVQTVLVSGVGLVVGLNGTGGQILNENVAVTLEREMSLRGVGQPGEYEGTAFEGKSPRQVLQDPNVAAVLVIAATPPGAVRGSTFDVYVQALNASSLEGGRLLSTELRLGQARAFGGGQARLMGEARGDVFINPFAEPGRESDGVQRSVGRILDGGLLLEDLRLVVRLNSPSHARARLITRALNSRFPQGVGDDEPVARGRDENEVLVRVPAAYRERVGEFLGLLTYLQIDQSAPQVYAKRYVDALKAEPYLAEDLSLALQALGKPALPFIRELYDYPERAPRMAGLRAGAGLGDALVAPRLREMAFEDAGATRLQAIGLLGRVNAGPSVDQTLRGLLESDELTVRVAAYEALAARAERAQIRRLALLDRSRAERSGLPLQPSALERLARLRLPAGSMQGVARVQIDDKFLLDRVPFGDPLLYVTQQGTPRIVLFGERLELERPMFVNAWSGRLMLLSESETDPVRLRYQELPASGSPAALSSRVVTQRVSPQITELIDLMAREPSEASPIPGLGLTYSEVVGALHAIHESGGMNAGFAAERDRLLAQLIAAREDQKVQVRPLSEEDSREVFIFDEPVRRLEDPGERSDPGSLVVPLGRAEDR